MNLTSSTSLRIRPIEPADAQACGHNAFDAHQQVANLHNFPPEHLNFEFSIELIGAKLKDPNSYGVIAEKGRKMLGSVFANFFPSTPIGLVSVWFRSLAFHYATFASKAKGLMPPRYEWSLRAL